MKILPKGKDGWINLLLLPFKAYVIILPIVGHILSLIVQGTWRSRSLTDFIDVTFFLCIPILLLGALLQAIICKRGESFKTILFAIWALIIFFFPVFYPPSKIQTVLWIALNAAVLCYALIAFLRTKQLGFILLSLGCIVSATARVLMVVWNHPVNGNYGAYQDFVTIVQLASLTSQFLWMVGIVLIIHYVLKNYSEKSLSKSSVDMK